MSEWCSSLLQLDDVKLSVNPGTAERSVLDFAIISESEAKAQTSPVAWSFIARIGRRGGDCGGALKHDILGFFEPAVQDGDACSSEVFAGDVDRGEVIRVGDGVPGSCGDDGD